MSLLHPKIDWQRMRYDMALGHMGKESVFTIVIRVCLLYKKTCAIKFYEKKRRIPYE